MFKTRLLVVASYPIKTPLHGGQKRTTALLSKYRQVSNSVSFMGIFLKGSYSSYSKYDLPITDDSVIDQVNSQPEYTDIIVGNAVLNEKITKMKFIKALLKINPQVIHVEQPYMVSSISKILSEMNMNPVIILGSQNVEAELKHSIYKGVLGSTALRKLVESTQRVEDNAVAIANIITAVSTYDLVKHMERARSKRKFYFVVSNGIDAHKRSLKKVHQWQTYKKRHSLDNLILFVGSGHPPNFIGFEKLVSNINLDSHSRIFIVGGVGEYFIKKYADKNDIFWKNISVLGVLKEPELNGLIDSADILLLPILHGGGSNLKTAEAILSHKKIVATEYAFRGFEQYIHMPNVYIGNSNRSFKKALLNAIKTPLLPLSKKQIRHTERVTWARALGKLRVVALLSALVYKFKM
jgi:nicotinic acid mononucleotide adenylyltransferase